MILTNEKREELKVAKSMAENAAKKRFEDVLFPNEATQLAGFIDLNLSEKLISAFHKECDEAEKNGYFILPKIKVRIKHTPEKPVPCWTIIFEEPNPQNGEIKEIYEVSDKLFQEMWNVKSLIEVACEKAGTRFIDGEIEMLGYIEIDFRI